MGARERVNRDAARPDRTGASGAAKSAHSLHGLVRAIQFRAALSTRSPGGGEWAEQTRSNMKTMKITKHGNVGGKKKLRGECQGCGCKIECEENETKLLTDRDSPQGSRYVRCPECKRDFLWVV